MAGPQPFSIDDLQAKLDSFDSIPLFMKNLPDEDPADNVSLAALQSLVHEGTPDGKCIWRYQNITIHVVIRNRGKFQGAG
jgi:hypothetical protein